MGQINWTKVVIGGLLAGLVINVGEFVLNVVILADDWVAEMNALNRPAAFSGSQIAMFNVIGFLTGLGGAWLYAAIRPRYGPGPKTALCAGFTVWFLAYLLPSISYMTIGIFSRRLIGIGTAWGLMELAVAMLVAGYVYKEEPASSGYSTTAARVGG